MCELFFIKSKDGGIIRRERIRDMVLTAQEGSYHNSDGSGAYNRHGRVFRTEEPLHEVEVSELVSQLYGSRMLVMHVRASTRGSVCEENAHPFQEDESVLAHNGTMRGLNDHGSGDITDSKRFLKKVNSQEEENPVQDVKSALESTKGWLSIFYRDMEAEETLYFRNRASFTFAETSSVVIGATKADRLNFYSDLMPGRKVHNSFEPEEGKIYRISDGYPTINPVEEYELGKEATSGYSSRSYGGSRFSGHSARGRGRSNSYHEGHDNSESDSDSDYPESYKEYKRQRASGEEPLEDLYAEDSDDSESKKQEMEEMAELPSGFYR